MIKEKAKLIVLDSVAALVRRRVTSDKFAPRQHLVKSQERGSYCSWIRYQVFLCWTSIRLYKLCIHFAACIRSCQNLYIEHSTELVEVWKS
jgi:hypothetical protein